ncbi:MAG: SCO family protein [Crocinitomicaceae bacterium]|nr:SCO family protein [Crocinitomicaceae bacterium]
MRILTAFISFFFLFACGNENFDSAEELDENELLTLPLYDGPDFTPYWNVHNPDTFHTVGSFEFINQNGEIISEKTVDSKIYLVNFFFSTCGNICPKMMKNMEKVQNHFSGNDEVLFLSHTVTPWYDSVPVLKNYVKNYHVIENKWHFLTGEKSEIYELARRSYFIEEEPGYLKDSSEFLHTEHFVLVDQSRHLRGIYNGTLELEMERVIEDIELLLQE